jgi:nitrate reductase gamma subunit
VALIISLWKPEWEPVWAMLNKNHPATAFLFDLTGIMVFLGVAFAFLRGFLRRSNQMGGLPGQDRLALGLIAGIVLIGFVLEGMRIAMTGFPDGSFYAIVGYGISVLFPNTSGLTEAYGYIWYAHAVLTGVFFAYLPFSRLLHIILAPLVLALNAVNENDHKRS